MKRAAVFLWTVLPTFLALSAATVASPMVQAIGNQQAILTMSPDPPQVGAIHAIVRFVGVSPTRLSRTHLSFATSMPSMQMQGPSGVATLRGESYTFDLQLGMAADWDLVLQTRGAVSGSATYRFAVGGAAAAGSSSASAMQSGENPVPWRTAAFALAILIIIVYFVVRRERRPVALALGGIALVTIIALAVAQARYTQAPMDMNAMENVPGSAPAAVSVVRLRNGESTASVVAPATVQPYLMQDVVARAAGILSDFTVYNGDRVHSGEQIAFLQAAELSSNAQAAAAAAQSAQIEAMHHAPIGVTIARSEAAATQSDLAATLADRRAKEQQAAYWAGEVQREQTLLREGAVSVQEYQDERAQAAAARAAYIAAQQQVASTGERLNIAHSKTLDAQADVIGAQARYAQALNEAQSQNTLASYRSIVAPDDAVVMQRLVDPGVYVQIGTPIARIAVIDKLRIRANVGQYDIARISIGDPIDARLPDGSTIKGRVSSVAPVADPTTHTAVVEAIVVNAHAGARPGGFVRVTIHTKSGTFGSPAVPSNAVVGGSTQPAVWIVLGGAAHRVPVRVLSDDGVTAIVQGDLPRNAAVITDGNGELQEGQPVAGQSP